MNANINKYLGMLFIAFGVIIASYFEEFYYFIPIFMIGWLLGEYFIDKGSQKNCTLSKLTVGKVEVKK